MPWRGCSLCSPHFLFCGVTPAWASGRMTSATYLSRSAVYSCWLLWFAVQAVRVYWRFMERPDDSCFLLAWRGTQARWRVCGTRKFVRANDVTYSGGNQQPYRLQNTVRALATGVRAAFRRR